MTDLALARTHDLTSDAAKARVRARYRAEARFKLYGLAAIGITGLFLVVVLGDIVGKGLPAFTQHSLMLKLTVDADVVDPEKKGDTASLRAGDYAALVRDALRAQFPDVKDRAGRKQLDGLLSSGASDLLRERVVADPKLVGQTVTVPVLLSDDVDLYYKGTGTKIASRPGAGIAAPSGTTGEVSVSVGTNAFAAELVAVKHQLSGRARALRGEAENLRQNVRRAEATKAGIEAALGAARAAGDAPRTAQLEAQLKSVVAEIDGLGLKAKEQEDAAAELQRRFDGAAVAEPMTSALPTVLVAINGGLVKVTELGNSDIKGEVLLAPDSTKEAAAGTWRIVTYATPEANRRVTDREVAWLERLKERGLVENAFNWSFFTSGDSREPELAGIRGALVGTALTLMVTLLLCLPIGVAAAIYLEEFAPKNRLTELIEVNINNLAAVPSIVFGLLGLAMFLNFFGLPRSAPLVGGLVLALLVLPTIIIAARAALKAVPPSIKEAALGVGASQQQAIFHHVLPLAMPGIMTGTIIGMAHALGETAPLLMIGMVAFIVEVPQGLTDAATVLPVQIYLWSDLPEIAFQAKTAAAIMVLLVVLFVMNGAAILLRRRFERRW